MNLSPAAQKIKVVILDVDGVLTNGNIGYGAGFEEEIKFFNVKDGSGIKMLQRAGLKVGILTGRSSLANRRRAEELQLDFIRENCRPKTPHFLELLKDLAVTAKECLYIGDDLIDWPVMKRVGISVAVADAAKELREAATFTTRQDGGRGAIREVAEWLLKEQNKWKATLEFYEF
jgi:3-deoxy-D-manno-octulosonate 8-phosphate phosphatase (KDO 8-P phosphatase)